MGVAPLNAAHPLSEQVKMAMSKYQTTEMDMSDIQLIEKQIERLDDKSFAELAAWFADYENGRWDQQIKADSHSGKFDAFVEKGLAENCSGRTTLL
jgi:hypothetical protein